MNGDKEDVYFSVFALVSFLFHYLTLTSRVRGEYVILLKHTVACLSPRQTDHIQCLLAILNLFLSYSCPCFYVMQNVEVHFITAVCENMVSAEAMRPGDILVASNGKTIEVLNTDAEGRLTLADALVYADNLGVDTIIDLATLTGTT